MPPLQTYNPIVIGFVEGKGAVHIPLKRRATRTDSFRATTVFSRERIGGERARR